MGEPHYQQLLPRGKKWGCPQVRGRIARCYCVHPLPPESPGPQPPTSASARHSPCNSATSNAGLWGLKSFCSSSQFTALGSSALTPATDQALTPDTQREPHTEL